MQKQAIPPDATPEQRATIEADNAFADKARGIISAVLTAEDTPAIRAELAGATVLAHRFKAQIDTLTKQVEALKKDSEELGRVKKASSTSRARQSVSAPSSAPVRTNGPQVVFAPTPESTLDSLLDEAEKNRR